MKIRSLKWREVPMWPPEWMISDEGVGEEGVLEDVQLRISVYAKPGLISVVANHLGDSRQGIIILEDLDQLKVLYYKLKENIGKPLTEVGDLEIDLSLSPQKRGQKQARPQRKPSLQKLGSHKK
jgi:hypothetical protein